MTSEIFIGIDVSKRTLEVNIFGEETTWQVGNTPGGLQTLIVQLQATPPTLIVFEATGGFERQAVRELSATGFAVSVVNPTRVRRFAEALGLISSVQGPSRRTTDHPAQSMSAARNVYRGEGG